MAYRRFVKACEQRNGGDKVYKNFDEMPVMLSVNQASEVLGISNVSLYKLIKKINHSLLFSWAEENPFQKNNSRNGLMKNQKDNYLAIEKSLW